ncbi:maltokinase N-terminal cap-like domain-containing protein [Thalassiella azotivora]
MTAGAAGGLDAGTEPLRHLLATWMPRQRWYPAKGRGVGLRSLAVLDLGTAPDGTTAQVHVVGLDSGDRFDVVQVPLTLRTAPRDGAEGGPDSFVGEVDLPGAGARWVYDGPHDPVYVQALLRGLDSPPGQSPPSPDAPSRVLGGEQSNTSVVVDPDGSDPTVVKVFRTLHGGANPDVEVTAALAAAGCDRVAQVRGWATGTWTGPDGAPATGHLAVAVEFLTGSRDAWVEAVEAVRAGRDFSAQARELGAATAAVHLTLADALGRTPMASGERDRMVSGLRSRVGWALDAAPALEPWTAALRRHADRLDGLGDLPDLQRVHGDYHLGQVLHSPTRGWILLDFEGEPLRPLAERAVPDLALRDVAGMLRSFDYAARYTTVGREDDDAHRSASAADAWAASARDAFVAGYADAGGEDPRARADLLAALELDKALYEVVYETRNRPAWLEVPLHAVRRLLGDPA